MTFSPISWAPVPLNFSDAVSANDELNTYLPDRTSCLAGDRLLVVDGTPAGSELVATISMVNTKTGRLEVDAERLDLGPGVVFGRLLCAEGVDPRLYASDRGTNGFIAYGLAVERGNVELGTPNATPPLGPGSSLVYGQQSVAVTYSDSEPSVEVKEPASPDAPGTVTSTGDIGVVTFNVDRWETIVEPDEGSVKRGERVYPLANPSDGGLIVRSTDFTEF